MLLIGVVFSVWTESAQLNLTLPLQPQARRRFPFGRESSTGKPAAARLHKTPSPQRIPPHHWTRISNIAKASEIFFKFINMPRARAGLPSSDERAQQSLFLPFFLSDWAPTDIFMNELREREMSECGQRTAMRVSLCDYVIVSVWKPYPGPMHSAPSHGGSCSSPVTKCCVIRCSGKCRGEEGETGGSRHDITKCLLSSSSVPGTHSMCST